MTRIFTTLAIVAVALLAANLALGLSIDGYNGEARRLLELHREVNQRTPGRTEAEAERKRAELQAGLAELEPLRRRASWHVWLGVAAALFTILVNSITVTYFVGTSRWCKEVVDTYRLDPALAARGAALKRRAFPWAMTAITAVLIIAALGAASDPAGNVRSSEQWVTWHLTAAMGGLAIIAWALWAQSRRMAENYEVIQAIMAEVRRARAARVDRQPETVAS